MVSPERLTLPVRLVRPLAHERKSLVAHVWLTKLAAMYASLPTYFFGAANLSSPSGGCAYGMPKYSQTSLALGDRWPLISPLLVVTELESGMSSADDKSPNKKKVTRLRISKAVCVPRESKTKVWLASFHAKKK